MVQPFKSTREKSIHYCDSSRFATFSALDMKSFIPGNKLASSVLEGFGHLIHRNIIDPCRCMPAFSPNSAGMHSQRSRLTIDAVNNTFPFLSSLCHRHLKGHARVVTPVEFAKIQMPAAREDFEVNLKRLLDRYGSDKANHHDYHYVYAAILRETQGVESVLEIGLGSNNDSIVSNMHGGGSPGGSLRALRDYLPNAQLYGADIDPSILFHEDRIDTFSVNQLSSESLESLGDKVPACFDLIIDDGLHAPDANINTLNFGLSRLKPGGWFVTEDISYSAIPIWEVISLLLFSAFECYLINGRGGWLFAIQRRETRLA